MDSQHVTPPILAKTKQQPFISYFAFGAMVNATSRKRRDIQSCNERPAILKNFKLIFSAAGMGTVVPCEGEEVHGIVMDLMTPTDWEVMQQFEKGYSVFQEHVHPYSVESNQSLSIQHPVLAHYFRLRDAKTAEEAKGGEGIPEERYLKVIATGLKEHGVIDDYIRRLLANKCTPSTKAEDYRQFLAVSNKLQQISWSEYQSLARQKLAFCVGNRVIVFDSYSRLDAVTDDSHEGDTDGSCHDETDSNLTDCCSLTELERKNHPILGWIEVNVRGKPDCTWTIWRTLLDPDLEPCECAQDLTPIHTRWAEHKCFEIFQKAQIVMPRVCMLLSPDAHSQI